MKHHRKQMAIKSHKIMTHLMCLMEDLEDVKADGREAKEMVEVIKILLPKMEKVIDTAFGSSTYLRSNTYLQDMQNRFETVVKKNYLKIT